MFSKYYRLIAISFVVVFLYGGMLWFVVPVEPGISWEGHLSGFVVGLAFAFIYKQKIAKAPKYEWEKPDYDHENDPFMKHFDENGNFIENLPEPEMETPEEEANKNRAIYQYTYKRSSDKDEN